MFKQQGIYMFGLKLDRNEFLTHLEVVGHGSEAQLQVGEKN